MSSDAIVASSGDVFADLGFSPEESYNLRLRSRLATWLCAEIKSRGLTQVQAADLFDVTQPRVSNLVRGKLHLFSLDALVNMAGRAGLDLSVSEARSRSGDVGPADSGVDVVTVVPDVEGEGTLVDLGEDLRAALHHMAGYTFVLAASTGDIDPLTVASGGVWHHFEFAETATLGLATSPVQQQGTPTPDALVARAA